MKETFIAGGLVTLVHAGLSGEEKVKWAIGRELTLADIDNLYDHKRKCIYAMTYLEKGEPVRMLLSRKAGKCSRLS